MSYLQVRIRLLRLLSMWQRALLFGMGLSHGHNRGWRKLIVEGDSKLIIDDGLKKILTPWSIQKTIQDIWKLRSFGESIRFQHVESRKEFGKKKKSDSLRASPAQPRLRGKGCQRQPETAPAQGP
ncbi:unnamed protein product [Prunus armeniaca]